MLWRLCCVSSFLALSETGLSVPMRILADSFFVDEFLSKDDQRYSQVSQPLVLEGTLVTCSHVYSLNEKTQTQHVVGSTGGLLTCQSVTVS